MTTRKIAHRLAHLRRLLNLGMVAELVDDVDEYDRLMAEFDSLAESLPLHVVIRNGLERRVVQPARRRALREGVLAQAPGADHVHDFRFREELDSWLCSCGSTYMGGRG